MEVSQSMNLMTISQTVKAFVRKNHRAMDIHSPMMTAVYCGKRVVSLVVVNLGTVPGATSKMI